MSTTWTAFRQKLPDGRARVRLFVAHEGEHTGFGSYFVGELTFKEYTDWVQLSGLIKHGALQNPDVVVKVEHQEYLPPSLEKQEGNSTASEEVGSSKPKQEAPVPTTIAPAAGSSSAMSVKDFLAQKGSTPK